MFSDKLSKLHFWDGRVSLQRPSPLLGYTTGKICRTEWPIDTLFITLVWVIFGINMFGTIIKRRENTCCM